MAGFNETGALGLGTAEEETSIAAEAVIIRIDGTKPGCPGVPEVPVDMGKFGVAGIREVTGTKLGVVAVDGFTVKSEEFWLGNGPDREIVRADDAVRACVLIVCVSCNQKTGSSHKKLVYKTPNQIYSTSA